jgi:hypothetical protein
VILGVNGDYFPKSFEKLVFVMVKHRVFFELRNEFLNIIWTIFGFQGFANHYGRIYITNGSFASLRGTNSLILLIMNWPIATNVED